MIGVDQTLMPEFANSPTITGLIEAMNQFIDPRADLKAFYNNVWNIYTANDFGLNIWGRILKISRVIPIPGGSGLFGFDNTDRPYDWQNWGGGPFAMPGTVLTGSYRLTTEPFRVLLLTKALANICDTTAPSLNTLIQNLFPGRGRCYVRDLGKMQMTYVFQFSVSSVEYAILAFSGVLPHPTGVLVNIVISPPSLFGFREGGYQTFGHGTFYTRNKLT